MEHRKNDHNQATVFVDADAFIASVKEDDPNHKRAKRLFEEINSYSIQFVTSNYVFAEAITVLSQRVSKLAALAYMESMTAADSPFQIKRASEMLDELAIQIFKQQTSKNTSFVDCTNMAFMQQFRLDAIFSFDQVYKTNKLILLEDWLAK